MVKKVPQKASDLQTLALEEQIHSVDLCLIESQSSTPIITVKCPIYMVSMNFFFTEIDKSLKELAACSVVNLAL